MKITVHIKKIVIISSVFCLIYWFYLSLEVIEKPIRRNYYFNLSNFSYEYSYTFYGAEFKRELIRHGFSKMKEKPYFKEIFDGRNIFESREVLGRIGSTGYILYANSISLWSTGVFRFLGGGELFFFERFIFSDDKVPIYTKQVFLDMLMLFLLKKVNSMNDDNYNSTRFYEADIFFGLIRTLSYPFKGVTIFNWENGQQMIKTDKDNNLFYDKEGNLLLKIIYEKNSNSSSYISYRSKSFFYDKEGFLVYKRRY